jgi:hypothetical protein
MSQILQHKNTPFMKKIFSLAGLICSAFYNLSVPDTLLAETVKLTMQSLLHQIKSKFIKITG